MSKDVTNPLSTNDKPKPLTNTNTTESGNNLNMARFRSLLPETSLPGAEFLGCGYDALGEGYASIKNVKQNPLFDWTKSKVVSQSIHIGDGTFSIPGCFSFQGNGINESMCISGQTVEEFISNFSQHYAFKGNYLFFSVSAAREFSRSEFSRSDYEFSRIQNTIGLWSLSLTAQTIASLRDYLTDDFKNALDNLDVATPEGAEKLFTYYGSHFLTGIVIGGRALQVASSLKSAFTKSVIIGEVARASLDMDTKGATSDLSKEDSQEISIFKHSSQISREVTGGKTTINAFSSPADYAEWSDTINHTPTFVDFLRTAPLCPIWTLISKEQKEKADYLEKYYTSIWEPWKLEFEYVDDLRVIVGDNPDIQPDDKGFTKIPVDLNAGAGGLFIFLCYHKKTFDPSAPEIDQYFVDDIVVVDGKNANAPASSSSDKYIKIDVDLNAGAHGDWLYLCFRKSKFNRDNVITDVTVVDDGHDPNKAAPVGFTKFNLDLNRGAGGDLIYVCFSKHASLVD